MGVRPPPSDTGGGDAIEFGIAAVAAQLEDAPLSFPATEEEVTRALSNPEIAYDANSNTVSLADALERTDRARFDSEKDLLNALHPVFEEYRTSRAPGLLAQVRSLIPL